MDQDHFDAKSQALNAKTAKTNIKNAIKWLKTRLFRSGRRAEADAAILSIEPDSDNQTVPQIKPAQSSKPIAMEFLPPAKKIVPQKPHDNNASPALGSMLLPPAKLQQTREPNRTDVQTGYYAPVPDVQTGYYAPVPDVQTGQVPSNVRDQNDARRAWRETVVIPRDPVPQQSNSALGNNARPGIRQPATPPGNTPRLGVNGSTRAKNPVGQSAREGLITQSNDAQETRQKPHLKPGGLTKPGCHSQN